MEMYRQDTDFAAANTPLFTQFFGPAPRAAAVTSQRKHSSQQTTTVSSACFAQPAAEAASAVGQPLPRHAAEQDEQFLLSSAACDDGEEAKTEGGSLTGDQRGPGETREKPTLPFRVRMREMERRFEEQMELHRGLNAAVRQLDTIHSEVSLHRTERRTAVLTGALFPNPPFHIHEPHSPHSPFSPPSPHLPPSSPPPGDPLLDEVLASYERERRERNVQPAPATRRGKAVDIVRPPEEPRPYVRVVYVPPESTATARSYSEDWSSSGAGKAVSASSPWAPTQTVSAVSVGTDMPSPVSSSIPTDSVATATSMSSRSSRAAEGGTRDAGVFAALCELRRACAGANRLMHELEERESPQSQSRTSSQSQIQGTASRAGDENWEASIRRDMRDVRKMRRFVAHLKSNIRAIDCQQRAREARRALLVKAQRLARARKRMQRDGIPLADVMDDVADLLGSRASDGGDSNGIVDEVATALDSAGGSWDSVSDELIIDDDDDENNNNNNNRKNKWYNDSLDGEVMDEVDVLRGAAGSGLGDEELLDEVADWASVESDFADALAVASDVEDLAIPSIPSDASGRNSVRESHGNGSDTIVDETAGHKEWAVLHKTSISYESDPVASHEFDADVSSFMPTTSCTDHGEITKTGNDEDDNDNVSLKSALVEREDDAEARPLVRSQSLTSRYTVEANSGEDRGSGGDARGRRALAAEVPQRNATGDEECAASAGERTPGREWREQQTMLIRQLRPKYTALELPVPAENHWAALEEMMLCRFSPGAADFCAIQESRNQLSDEEEWGEYYGSED